MQHRCLRSAHAAKAASIDFGSSSRTRYLDAAARAEIFYKELLSLAKLLAGGNTASETRLGGLRPDAELPSHPRRAGKSFVGTLRELDSGRRRPPRHHPTGGSQYAGHGIP